MSNNPELSNDNVSVTIKAVSDKSYVKIKEILEHKSVLTVPVLNTSTEIVSEIDVPLLPLNCDKKRREITVSVEEHYIQGMILDCDILYCVQGVVTGDMAHKRDGIIVSEYADDNGSCLYGMLSEIFEYDRTASSSMSVSRFML